MRLSCNGCRVLRKGCSGNCSIRPCLEWITSPESQANATLFLAKFYGRAGLINLINAAPEHCRPTVFRTLLYEACGRIVNPIYGSVGLLWSGNWQLCRDAVHAILEGSPITRIALDTVQTNNRICHLSKDENPFGSNGLHRVRTRAGFKRSWRKRKVIRDASGSSEEEYDQIENDSAVNDQLEVVHLVEGESCETVEESLASVLTSLAENRGESETDVGGMIELELKLGQKPVDKCKTKEVVIGAAFENPVAGRGMDLSLEYLG